MIIQLFKEILNPFLKPQKRWALARAISKMVQIRGVRGGGAEAYSNVRRTSRRRSQRRRWALARAISKMVQIRGVRGGGAEAYSNVRRTSRRRSQRRRWAIFEIALGCVLVLIGTPTPAKQLIPLKDYLKQELAGSAKLSKEVFTLTEPEKKQLKQLAENAQDPEFTFYYGKTSEGNLEKSCTVVPQQGKEGPLLIGVCFDPLGLVTSVTVLSSEEDRGQKVTEAPFLKQFAGKNIAGAFQVGSDIDGVSGATISSRAVSEAVRKSAFAFKTYVKGKK